MINWQNLEDLNQIQQLTSLSSVKPVLIFKHSTTCSISQMAKLRLEESWVFNSVETFYLDVKRFRNLSDLIASTFSVHHESPQVLLIDKGECIYDASHFDISCQEISETLDFHQK
jgi:bacillithiol system protein YtxJ